MLGTQPLLLAPLGDVRESEHTPDQLTVALYGIRPVLDRKARAVRAPHHLVVYMRPLMLSKRLVDAALLDRVGLSVRARVVHQFVHLPSEEIGVAPEAKQLGTCRVGKRAVAIEIYPVDPLASGVQQEAYQLVTTS